MTDLRYGLTLFVTGATPRSMRAVANVRDFCDRELEGAYDLDVVDLYQAPERAQPANVIVAPTLVRDAITSAPEKCQDLQTNRSGARPRW